MVVKHHVVISRLQMCKSLLLYTYVLCVKVNFIKKSSSGYTQYVYSMWHQKSIYYTQN